MKRTPQLECGFEKVAKDGQEMNEEILTKREKWRENLERKRMERVREGDRDV